MVERERRKNVLSRVVDAANAAYDFGMYQHRGEIQDLGQLLVDHDVQRVLEIGGHRGGTAMFWGALASDRVVTVDLPDGRWGGVGAVRAAERDASLSSRMPHYSAVIGDSHERATWNQVVDLMTADSGLLFDFLFIDGDHSLSGVVKDYEDYSPLVRPGGLVAFHDVIDTPRHREDGVEVPAFWDVLRGDKLLLSDDQGWGGIGVLFL